MPNIIIDGLKIEDLEFIGENYVKKTISETEKRKEDVLNSYDEFQIRKLNFLNERYDNYNTKITYWNIYANMLHYYEKNTNTDIMNMEANEIENLINACTYALVSAKKTARTFCIKYKNWAVDKGHILINTLTNTSEIQEEKTLLKNRLYSKDAILNIIEKTQEGFNLNFIKPLVLGRMGIIGKQAIYMRNLKWRDIDVEKCEITIHNEDETKFKTIKVDRWAMDTLIKIQKCINSDMNFSKDMDIDSFTIENEQYVLDSGFEGEMLKYNSLNNWMRNVATEFKITRISFAELLFSRQMELLLRRRKCSRLTNDDIQEILSEYTLDEDVSLAKVTILKRRYQDLTEDEVFRSINNDKDNKTTLKIRKERITIGNVEEEYEKIIEKLDFKLEE
ncbi:hypothetical protein [Clostridium botulinum]|uniref:hypothetical protein n=1 Tax=Clostridium botulinum TaxID=1491 RepID=UPI001C9AB259|nr:hypothetical protein [Clostridium botulinum]MBY6838755.1 hypothetical protein [Clostridium botulinum]